MTGKLSCTLLKVTPEASPSCLGAYCGWAGGLPSFSSLLLSSFEITLGSQWRRYVLWVGGRSTNFYFCFHFSFFHLQVPFIEVRD